MTAPRPLQTALAWLLLATGCATGTGGFLIDTSAEPAGANCPAGGVRVDVGEDGDGSDTLDVDEIQSTEYICNGQDGADGADGTDGTNGTGGTGDRIRLTTEPAGANCASGGTRIDAGPDTNANGTLDTAEITSTRYVCDGGAGDIVEAYTGAVVAMASNTSATLQSASFTAPAAGTVFAQFTGDAFCSSATGTGHACAAGSPASDLCVSLGTSATAPGCPAAGPYAFLYLAPNTTESVTYSATFTVAAGSTTTVYARGSTADAATTGEAGVWRRKLTLIYIPD